MVIPNFVRQALSGSPITIHGDGNQSRCFAHVADVVPAMVGLLEHPQARGDVFNVGSQEEISIRELAERILKFSGSSSELKFIPYEQAYSGGFEDMHRRVPDISKIEELIGYNAKYNLDDILKGVIEDFRCKE